MKKNLFLLVVGLLSSVMSFAEAPEGWVDPATSLAKTTTIIADGSTVYYLKNETVGSWFIQGNNWWAQACVAGPDKEMPETSPYGFKIRFSNTTTHEGFYQIEDMSPDGKQVKDSWKYLFDNAGSIYTDYGSQGIDKTYWKFTFDADNNFTFVSYMNQDKKVGLVSEDGTNPKVFPDDGASSRSGGSQTGDYTMNNTGNEVATVWSLWSMGAPEAVAEWNAANDLMSRLQEIFEESEGGFDVSPYAAMIGEQKGTLENAERIKALISQVNAEYMVWKFNEGGQVPVEVAIVNPSFETGNMNGWTSLDGTSIYAAQGNKAFDRVVGEYYAEFWHKNGNYSAAQTINDLPMGVYKLAANVYSSNGKAQLFVNDKETELIEASNRYSLVYELMSGTDSKLTFGVKSSDENNYWNCVDDFSLKYLGSGGVGYANTFEETYQDKASYMYQQGLAELVAALKVATGDAVQTAYEAAKAYEDGEVADNVAAWAKYNELCEAAVILANDPDFKDYAAKLASMVQQKYTITNTTEDPSTTELNKDYDDILAEMNNVKSHIQPGTDITKTYLKNADFTQNIVGINEGDATKGWRIDGTKGGGNWLINTGAKCGECWNGENFDFYQIVEDAPVGVYQIKLQGFTRAKRGNDSWYSYFDAKTGELLETPIFGDWTPNKANVYLNDNTGELSIVYKYPHAKEDAFFDSGYYEDPLEQYQYPNDLHSAGLSYAAGEYEVEAFGLVAKEGDLMRVGVKGNNYGLDNWMCFANFRLIYQGFDADFIRPEYQKAVQSLGEAHIGTELQGEQKELQGKAAGVSESDGKAMFNLLSEIYAFNTKKADSEEVFEELNNQIKNLQDTYQTYKETATAEALKAAQLLQAKAMDAYEDPETLLPTVTTEAAKEILEEFDPVLKALRIPKSAGSDDDPADFTSVIQNANMASSVGWTDEKKNMTVDGTNKIAEFFDKENFNVYQKLTGLPEGLYEVQVQGFYRAGEIAEDWPAVAAGTESNSMLYVINDNKTLVDEDPEALADTINCALRHVSAEATGEDPNIAGTTTIKPFAEQGDETPWYMPNNLASAVEYFTADFYVNKIYFYIWGPDDTITLGVKKEGPAVTHDWTAFSNWKLTSYGNMSVKEPGAQTQSCDPVTPTYNPHAALTALINEATAYYESIANNAEYAEIAAELYGAIDAAILINNNTEATQQDLDDAVVALKDALDKAKKATSISEVGAKVTKNLVNGKFFKNGKLFIIKNGKIYTATGANIK